MAHTLTHLNAQPSSPTQLLCDLWAVLPLNTVIVEWPGFLGLESIWVWCPVSGRCSISPRSLSFLPLLPCPMPSADTSNTLCLEQRLELECGHWALFLWKKSPVNRAPCGGAGSIRSRDMGFRAWPLRELSFLPC